jgi:hypothetical protein
MELLKVHANGQWELVHKTSFKNPEYKDSEDMNYMSYKRRALDGSLPEDHGQKGVLHNVGNSRPPMSISDQKLQGKVPVPVKSATRDRQPGLF